MTRAAPLGRAAPLSSTWRFDSESPIRWLVRALLGNTGLCGSERGELSDVGRSASSSADRAARRVPGRAARAEARRRAKAPQRHPFFREPPHATRLNRAWRGCEHRARARAAGAHPRVEDGHRASSGNRASRRSTVGPRTAEGGDLPRLRSPLLQSGAPRLLVRVAPFDTCPERSVPRPVPDGLERTEAVRPRRDSAPAGDRGTPVLRRLRPGLEPLELQAGIRLLLDMSFPCKLRVT